MNVKQSMEDAPSCRQRVPLMAGSSAPRSLSNKLVLPTAHTSLNHYAPDPVRRQTGQPLASLR